MDILDSISPSVDELRKFFENASQKFIDNNLPHGVAPSALLISTGKAFPSILKMAKESQQKLKAISDYEARSRAIIETTRRALTDAEGKVKADADAVAARETKVQLAEEQLEQKCNGVKEFANEVKQLTAGLEGIALHNETVKSTIIHANDDLQRQVSKHEGTIVELRMDLKAANEIIKGKEEAANKYKELEQKFVALQRTSEANSALLSDQVSSTTNAVAWWEHQYMEEVVNSGSLSKYAAEARTALEDANLKHRRELLEKETQLLNQQKTLQNRIDTLENESTTVLGQLPPLNDPASDSTLLQRVNGLLAERDEAINNQQSAANEVTMLRSKLAEIEPKLKALEDAEPENVKSRELAAEVASLREKAALANEFQLKVTELEKKLKNVEPSTPSATEFDSQNTLVNGLSFESRTTDDIFRETASAIHQLKPSTALQGQASKRRRHAELDLTPPRPTSPMSVLPPKDWIDMIKSLHTLIISLHPVPSTDLQILRYELMMRFGANDGSFENFEDYKSSKNSKRTKWQCVLTLNRSGRKLAPLMSENPADCKCHQCQDYDWCVQIKEFESLLICRLVAVNKSDPARSLTHNTR
ncbi:hypothetical protein VTL71DRAFT_3035 [Oculimacula yallundae]|uniref:Uncharacterized protein n=1 Tax=Oculimacula yallundae TaxID=86028 RepID=A0ABR4C6Q9_9HELO